MSMKCKKAGKISFCVAVFYVACVLCSVFSSASYAEDVPYYRGTTEYKTVWDTSYDEGKYERYRLPGIIVTEQNTVILYGEARTGKHLDNDGDTDDHCEMDIYIRRSTDGGETFEEPVYIAKGAEWRSKGLGETINNPVMISGNDGKLHLLFSCNVGLYGVWYSSSNDDGITWSSPVDISEQIGCGTAYSRIACGPGHGICLNNGRLIVPVWVNYGSYDVFTVYSDDNGETWKFGKKVSGNKDETSVAELSDGSVMCNSRNTPYRMISVSKTGYSQWSSTFYDSNLPDPACFGGMCSVDLEGLPYSILFVNCANTTARNQLTIRVSFNDGMTWEKSLLLDQTGGGYADVAVDKDGKVYVVYEKDMGKVLEFVSMSFYDVFCAKDPSTTSSITAFDDQLFEMIQSKENSDVTKTTDGYTCITINGEDNPSVVFGFTDITKNIKLSEYPAIAIRMKVVEMNSDSIYTGLDLRCGRNDFKGTLDSTALIADGKTHVLLFDMSGSESAGGNLYDIKLNFSSDDGISPGTKLVIYGMEFFQSRNEALDKYPEAESGVIDYAVITTANEDEPAPESEKGGGCNSSVTGVIFGLSVISALGSAILFRNKNRS